jgi:predicted AAA+ superfamily ATPase
MKNTTDIDEEPPMRLETAEDLKLNDDDLEPPFVIIVQGSTQSGKTTLIKSLV